MNISKNVFVTLVYELHSGDANGPLVEKCEVSRPLGFVFGAGRMLPKFEENLEGLVVGDNFEFVLSPEEAYGDVRPEAIVEVPKSIFIGADGNLREEFLQLGARVPMINDQGQHIVGTVLEVSDDVVKLDFNHPLAGETLAFSGSIIDVREATADELIGGHGCGGCGGGCHGGDDEEGCGGSCGGCGGGCH